MSKLTRDRFERLRAAVLAKRAVKDSVRRTLELKYGQCNLNWCTAKEVKIQLAAQAAYDKAADRMHALLEASPRDWKEGVPTAWAVEELSYDDACKPLSEALSVVPPMAYGYSIPKR